jgi:anti-sigma28 factor (negative regulator of flagellin synthesis)
MKVPGSDGNNDALKRVQEEKLVRQRAGAQAGSKAGSKAASADSLISALAKEGSVDTFTASPLRAEVGRLAKDMTAERQARVESLRQKIQNGTYQQPSADKLAQSVGEEITLNILLDGVA